MFLGRYTEAAWKHACYEQQRRRGNRAGDQRDDSGDLHLRVLTRRDEAGFGLYGQRDPQTILNLTRMARQIAGATPSAGLADLVSTEAKALALLGRHQEARQAEHADRPGPQPT